MTLGLTIIYAAVYCVLVYAFSLSLSLTLCLSPSLSLVELANAAFERFHTAALFLVSF